MSEPQPERPRRRLAAGAIVAAGLLVLALPWLGARNAPLPILVSAEVVADQIYQAVDRGRRLPVELALPHIARAGASLFIDGLPLDEDVRARIQARLTSTGFVDEMVPFLLALKSMYLAPDDARVDDFETALRARIRPEEKLAGVEHSLFRWEAEQPDEDEADEDESGLDPALIAALLTFYDALYLREQDPAGSLSDRLACGSAEIEARIAASAQRSQPALRTLLETIRNGMEPGSELATAVDGILSDEERLETVGISVVQFIELMVCKHYRILSSRLMREQQLKRFLEAELDQPGAGRLWAYLDHAQNDRRYAALVVVDGLQGHLLEALAAPEGGSRFIEQILREQQDGEARLAASSNEGPDLAQRTEFLARLAEGRFEHPAYLPFFRDLYADGGEQDAIAPWGIARSGISTTPTISVRNLPVVKTGAPVAGEGSTGIPNFHFVDRGYTRNGERQGRAYYFFGNDALQLSALTARSGMQSLFERLAARSSYSCAAQYDEWAQAGIDPFLNLALGEASRDFGEVLCMRELEQRAANEARSRELRHELLEMREQLARPVPFYDWYRAWGQRALRARAKQLIEHITSLEAEAFPELLVYYNPWPDHFAHFKGPFSDEILSPSGELARLDHWLGRLTELYRTAGVFERTLFGMVGDHGLSPVFRLESPQALVFGSLAQRGVPLRIVKISSDEGEGPKLTHALEPPSMRGYDVVIASTAGGNLMLDLFIDQQDRWHEQPLEQHLRAWRPIAWQEQALRGGAERSLDLIAELRSGLGDSLDYLVVRSEPCSRERCTIRVLGPGGEALITRRGARIHYDAIEGDLLETARRSPYEELSAEDERLHADLLRRCRVEASIEDEASWCSEGEWRRLARYTPRPDSVVQLAHLYDLEHAGTVNLFPAAGVGYNSIVPGRHAGESFHEKDAFAGLWGAPLTRTRAHGRIEAALGGSIPTAIYEYLEGEAIDAQDDSWGYPSLWRALYPPGRDGSH